MSDNQTTKLEPLTTDMIDVTFSHFGLALAIFIGSQDYNAAQSQISQDDISIVISLWFQKPALVIVGLLDANEEAISTTIDMLVMEGSSKDAEIKRLQESINKYEGYNNPDKTI